MARSTSSLRSSRAMAPPRRLALPASECQSTSVAHGHAMIVWRTIGGTAAGLGKSCPKEVMSCRWRHLIDGPTVAPMSEPPRPPGEYGMPSDPNSGSPPQPPTSGGGYGPPPSSGGGAYGTPPPTSGGGYEQPGYQQP